MKAITYWNSTNDISKKDFLVLALNAFYWKKYNGSITLYTDKKMYDILLKYNILKLWDSVDYETLDNIQEEVNFNIYPNASFNYIIDKQDTPFVFIHPSIMIYNKIEFDESNDIVFLYKEQLHYPYVINFLSVFKEDDPLVSKYCWDCSKLIVYNTNFIYINNLDFIKEYNEDALTIINAYGDASIKDAYNTRQSIANKRLIYLLAEKYKIECLGNDIHSLKFKENKWLIPNDLTSNIDNIFEYYLDTTLTFMSEQNVMNTLNSTIKNEYSKLDAENIFKVSDTLIKKKNINAIKKLF